MDGIFQVSLVAAYIAGMVALFAPCCLSYLFPAYIGNIFRERKYVLFMTFIYSLGILTVMLPVVLGVKALSDLFFKLHDYTYLVGGGVMFVVAFMALLGLKSPFMLHFGVNQKQKPDIGSIYILGIFSGITSACCAPVLIGVLALSSFSPSLFGALLIGIMYVLGMVTPLYLASLFIHKRNLLANPVLKKKLYLLKIGSKGFPIFLSNLIAFGIFVATGSLMMYLTFIGKVAMGEAEMAVMQKINNLALEVTKFTDKIWGLNWIFGIVIFYLFYLLIKQAIGSLKVGGKKAESCCRD